MPTLLAVIPHPDDESYSFAATMAAAALSGWDCRVVCASAGGAGKRYDGLPFHRPPLAEKRVQELGASCELLGAAPPECWGLVDGGLRTGVSHSARVAKAIVACAPQVVLTLGADGAYGHPDHIAVHRWVSAVLTERPDVAGLYASFRPGAMLGQYELCVTSGVLGSPPILEPAELGEPLAQYEVGTGHVRETKLAAIAAHRSQLAGGDPRNLFPEGIVDGLLNVERFMDAGEQPTTQTARLFAGFVAAPSQQ